MEKERYVMEDTQAGAPQQKRLRSLRARSKARAIGMTSSLKQ